jgi:hypothetical protein
MNCTPYEPSATTIHTTKRYAKASGDYALRVVRKPNLGFDGLMGTVVKDLLDNPLDAPAVVLYM